MSTEELTKFVLSELKKGSILNSETLLCNDQPIDQNVLQGVLSSLTTREMVTYVPIERDIWILTEEGKSIAENGSHEAKVFMAIPPGETGISISEINKLLGESAQIGQGKAFKNKWIGKNKEGQLIRLVESIQDITRENLIQISNHKTHTDPSVLNDLKRRKLCTKEKLTFYRIEKGPQYSETLTKQATDLTADMLASGAWEKLSFKKYNFNALGQKPSGGHLHPLMKVREEFRKIFFEMGFEEMPTNRYVESSFWNFDALFQPQQHPARDLQDTFFLKYPVTSDRLPNEYVNKVAQVHSKGGYGSLGYNYDWKREEAEKLILRTHTTSVSARMLYQLAQNGFKPSKYFSIDRVFRNETVDATHLAEFHQVEGVIADEGITLGDLIGILNVFCNKLGIQKLRFKPTYNPYTEPSMEIFSYHEGLKKWVEIGNSGMFRPELLLPMGLPENVRVIAWGLSLERPTMIKYGIDDIRSLLGPKCDLEMIASNPICRFDKKMGREL